jgi:hypothetical protein
MSGTKPTVPAGRLPLTPDQLDRFRDLLAEALRRSG